MGDQANKPLRQTAVNRSAIPERARANLGLPDSPTAPPRSSVRAIVLTAAALAVIAGGLGWVGGTGLAPNASRQSPLASSDALATWADRLTRQGREHEMRLASMRLDLKQQQENLSHLTDDARSLATRTDALLLGVGELHSELGKVKAEAVLKTGRIEDRLDQLALAAAPTADESAPPYAQLLERLARVEGQLAASEAARATAAPVAAGLDSSEPRIAAKETMQVTLPPMPDRLVGFDERPAATPTVRVTLPSVSEGLEGFDGPIAHETAQTTISPTMTAAIPEASGPRKRRRATVPGWRLHRVQEDLALVEGRGRHYEVRAGEILPGVGVVRGIEKRGEKSVVVTARGLIVEQR
jgi:hypothetical protein